MRNNVKLLTNAELAKLNEKYVFEYDDKHIIVKNRHYNRVTFHDRSKPFFISPKIRKITFTVDAIEHWIKLQEEHLTNYSLLDVQQAENQLYVTYQDNDYEHVKRQLKKESTRIKVI